MEENRVGKSSCLLYVFTGRNGCVGCEVGLMSELESACIQEEVHVTFVTYYKGKVISPIIRNLESKYNFQGYYDIDFSQLPIEKFHRDSILKGNLFFIVDNELIYENDFTQPSRLLEILGDCAICRAD